jgi:hypothetical protein
VAVEIGFASMREVAVDYQLVGLRLIPAHGPAERGLTHLRHAGGGRPGRTEGENMDPFLELLLPQAETEPLDRRQTDLLLAKLDSGETANLPIEQQRKLRTRAVYNHNRLNRSREADRQLYNDQLQRRIDQQYRIDLVNSARRRHEQERFDRRAKESGQRGAETTHGNLQSSGGAAPTIEADRQGAAIAQSVRAVQQTSQESALRPAAMPLRPLFLGLSFDSSNRTVWKGNDLTADFGGNEKPFAVSECLWKAAGQTVSMKSLHELPVWGDTPVEDNAIQQAISTARVFLHGHASIQSQRKIGYRMVAYRERSSNTKAAQA